MTEDPQIAPTPDSSGNKGTQSESTADSELVPAKPLEGLPITRAIEGIASTHSRSLGGDTTSALIAGATNQLAYDFQELKREHESLKGRFETQRNELEAARTESAVLTERINSEGKNKHLRNLCIAFGTGLLSTGIYLSRTAIDGFAIGALVIGGSLLLFGWFSGPGEVRK